MAQGSSLEPIQAGALRLSSSLQFALSSGLTTHTVLQQQDRYRPVRCACLCRAFAKKGFVRMHRGRTCQNSCRVLKELSLPKIIRKTPVGPCHSGELERTPCSLKTPSSAPRAHSSVPSRSSSQYFGFCQAPSSATPLYRGTDPPLRQPD